MHLHALPLAFLLFHVLPLLSAAPASESGSTISTAQSITSEPPVHDLSSNRPSVTTKASSTVAQRKPTVAVSPKPHHVVPPTKPTQIPSGPNPTRPATPPPVKPSFHPHPHPQGQSVAALVFEILGGLAGCLLVLSLLRCVYSYNRTPNRDRITAILHRHQLQREMEELERNPPDPRRSVEPPPPYLAPPTYPDDEHTLLSRPSAVPFPSPLQPAVLLPPNG
ncbi:hypothetical protein C8R44DRAFT_872654 [Mycena epipterygia]|nr:hypothetical protein C8R44DRAFT_872654 [Mycena epipterygia]